MKLHQCSICGHVDAWGPEWSYYSSLALEDAAPYLAPRVCSKKCADELQKRMDAKTIILPKINSKSGFFSKPPQGYTGQPSAEELFRLYNVERAIIKQP